MGERRNVMLLCAVLRVLVLLKAVGLPNAYRIWYARSVRETKKCQLPQEHGKCYSDRILAECLYDLSSRIRGASGIERKSILWGS